MFLDCVQPRPALKKTKIAEEWKKENASQGILVSVVNFQ